MNILDAAEAVAKPLWLRALPYVVVVGFVIGGLFAAYEHGCTVTAAADKITADALLQKHNKEIISWQGKVRTAEQKAADDMAAIDAQHQKDIADEKAATDRTIADLLDGTLRLRKRLAAVQRAASNLPSAAAGAGSSDDAQGVGLQQADADLLVRTAAEADSVADQLRACQAVVRADRAVHAQ